MSYIENLKTCGYDFYFQLKVNSDGTIDQMSLLESVRSNFKDFVSENNRYDEEIIEARNIGFALQLTNDFKAMGFDIPVDPRLIENLFYETLLSRLIAAHATIDYYDISAVATPCSSGGNCPVAISFYRHEKDEMSEARKIVGDAVYSVKLSTKSGSFDVDNLELVTVITSALEHFIKELG